MRIAQKSLRNFLLACLLLPGTTAFAAVSMNELQSQAQQMKTQEAKIWSAREATHRGELQKQLQQTKAAEARYVQANAKTKSLDAEWNSNDARIVEMRNLLNQHQGSLGELFGVTRQVAGDAATVLNQSLVNIQFPAVEGEESRVEFMRRIAGAKDLPAFAELERIWIELLQELTETGKVLKFTAPVVQIDKSVTTQEVVRIGPFMAVSGGDYLQYIPNDKTLAVMERQLSFTDRAIATDLESATGTAAYHTAVVDPSRGALMAMVVNRPDIIERIQHGEVVGYVIVAVGLLGVTVAIFQYGYLFITRRKIQAQLGNLSKPETTNPVGRLLTEYQAGGWPGESPEVVKLRLSEAVLREVPKLQRFQPFLRVAVAAGPLLGLVGTVIGMIITFHTITASGSSDPKLMAHGIGQAMIATVLGLGIAIPILFLVTGLGAISNELIRVLDEQCQSLLARDLQKNI